MSTFSAGLHCPSITIGDPYAVDCFHATMEKARGMWGMWGSGYRSGKNDTLGCLLTLAT